MTLTEFLLARIAEDEALARTVWPERYTARMLADCEAKRQIVARHKPLSHGICQTCQWIVGQDDIQPEAAPCFTLRALALPYAQHPDLDEAWARLALT